MLLKLYVLGRNQNQNGFGISALWVFREVCATFRHISMTDLVFFFSFASYVAQMDMFTILFLGVGTRNMFRAGSIE